MEARPEDISATLARAAHAGSSFVPEKRAAAVQAEYVEDVNGFRASLLELAATDEQRAIVEAEIERYRQNFIRFESAYLAARSRCMSPMITGPANFPVERMRKRNATANRRLEEFLAWRTKARNACRRAVAEGRGSEQVLADEWGHLSRKIARNMAIVMEIDAGTSPMNRAAFTTGITGRLERLAKGGESELVQRALDFIRKNQADWKKPFLAARNSAWELVAEATEVAAAPKPAGQEDLFRGEGFRCVNDHDAERVRIYFEAIPAPEMREKLKGSGWKWSPTAGAWQRQNTQNAIYSARHILAVPQVSP